MQGEDHLCLFIINAIGIICIFVFALAGNFFVAVVAILLFKVFRALNEPVYTTWLTQNIDTKARATVLSMRGQVDAFGQIIGGPPVGSIGNIFSIRVAILASVALLSPVLMLYAYASRKIKQYKPERHRNLQGFKPLVILVILPSMEI
jgi:MFS transporter, DHA3 family, tetracycline resistance protein